MMEREKLAERIKFLTGFNMIDEKIEEQNLLIDERRWKK